IKPHARNLTVKPHIRLWSDSRASGHVEIEGFFASSVLRLSGFTHKSEKPLPEEEEKKKVLELIESSLVQFLKKTYTDCQVTVSPATVMKG
ncbi:MAG TPA: hypothetical protein VMH87_19750, partial [Pseudomonadales bacterium]|nr:hypothetical protein [Pseudomonadales bacterium]